MSKRKNKRRVSFSVDAEVAERMDKLVAMLPKFNPYKDLARELKRIIDNEENLYGIKGGNFRDTKNCFKCGSLMRKVEYKGDKFWGCSAFPDCKNLIKRENEVEK